MFEETRALDLLSEGAINTLGMQLNMIIVRGQLNVILIWSLFLYSHFHSCPYSRHKLFANYKCYLKKESLQGRTELVRELN